MIIGIDHVGIAVVDAAAAGGTFARVTAGAVTGVEPLEPQGVRVCFVSSGAAGSPRLELLEPAQPDTAVGRFLARRGEGLHHICFAVDSIAEELERLRRAGFEPVEPAPRRGHGGLVAFLHPKGVHGVLVELLQRDSETDRSG